MQAEVNVEGGAKIFLQNKLQRSRTKLLELKPLLEEKSKFKDFDFGRVHRPALSPPSCIREGVGTRDVICGCRKWESLIRKR